jgi:putative SOS response-associated peptidase YedK
LLTPSYNTAPSQGLPTILSANPYVITVSAWGFRPEWADWRDVTPLINARAETVATKPFFRRAFRTKRCLVLADGFYEWQRTGKAKVPYRITLRTDEPFTFAGIWSLGHDAQRRPWSTFAILTTAANSVVAQLHHRMPVILHPQDEATWLNPAASPAQAQTCLKPFPAHLLRISAVSPKVNSPAYNTPDVLQCMAPDTPEGARHWQKAAVEAGFLFSASAPA